MTIVRTGTVRSDCTFAEPLEESIAIVSINNFENYCDIIPDGSVLLNLAS